MCDQLRHVVLLIANRYYNGNAHVANLMDFSSWYPVPPTPVVVDQEAVDEECDQEYQQENCHKGHLESTQKIVRFI